MSNELLEQDIKGMASECAVEIGRRIAALDAVTSVTNDAEARIADGAVKDAKSTIKAVEAERKSWTRKLDDAKKRFMRREAEITEGLVKGVERVQKLATEYLNRKAAEAEAARKAAEDERRKALEAAKIEAEVTGEKVEVKPVEVAAPAPKVVGVKAREYWGFRIVDANAVPRAYCKPDEVAIRAYEDAARKNGAKVEDLKMEGVEFYREMRI